MKALLFAVLTTATFMMSSGAQAFCGFYVSKAGADLFNQASKVVLARSEGRTVITMANDFQGDMKEFAIVTPVPTVLEEGQVNITENRIIDHLDSYTAPRLVEYFDPNPCENRLYMLKSMGAAGGMAEMAMLEDAPPAPQDLGVTIEAEYTVGEYDIVILSAEQNDGLLTYLNQQGYKLPAGAKDILGSYIKQDMKFFLAKVNLEEQAKSGYTYLRPIQVAFESEKFALPIRLGTLNAKGDQDLVLYTLTQNGRVESTNYRTVKIPTGQSIPTYVKDEFDDFYVSMFDRIAEKENNKVLFLEYAWDMNWCDPCAADPVPNKDLRTLGAWWVDSAADKRGNIRPAMAPPSQAANVYVTRLHARYNAQTFPEDIMLHETNDRENFQGRYVLNHAYKGAASCKAGQEYFASLPQRHEKEAQELAKLTGWDINAVREKMRAAGASLTDGPVKPPQVWWKDIWSK